MGFEDYSKKIIIETEGAASIISEDEAPAGAGNVMRDGGNVFVVCPDGFWRKGNVDIVCERYMIPQFGNVNEVVDHIKTLLVKST